MAPHPALFLIIFRESGFPGGNLFPAKRYSLAVPDVNYGRFAPIPSSNRSACDHRYELSRPRTLGGLVDLGAATILLAMKRTDSIFEF